MHPEPGPTAHLPWGTYLAAIRGDVDRLLEVATDTGADVPSCPEWTVGDLLEHLALVYRHKVESVRSGVLPDPWPPEDLDASDPRALLTRAADELLTELGAHDPADPTPTWWSSDQTVGFWYRRLALETVMHRVDGELAAGVRSVAIADDLALDGIDEMVRVIADRRRPVDGAVHPVTATLRLTSAGRTWEIVASADALVVEEIGPDAGPSVEGSVAAEVAGSPVTVFLWLWGRVPIDRLSVSGASEVAAEFRARLAEAA